MRWSPRKNAMPVTAASLHSQRDVLALAIKSDEDELDEITSALPGLIGDPEHAAEAGVRARELEAILPHNRRTLAAIAEEIPKAEKRQEIAGVEAEVAALETKTGKMGQTLQSRYSRAAQAFANILIEIDQNHEDWRLLQFKTEQVLGKHFSGQDVEGRLRRHVQNVWTPVGRTYRSLREVRIDAWDGSTLFDGENAR